LALTRETARALARLFPLQKQLQDLALANFQQRRAVRHGLVQKRERDGALYAWSTSRLALHALPRPSVKPGFVLPPATAAATDEPEGDPSADAPTLTMDQLKAMAAAALSGAEPELPE